MTTRILHVSQPGEAGVARVLLDYLTRQLAADDSDIALAVACPPDSRLAAHVRALGVELLPWEATRGPGAAVLTEVRALSALIRAWGPDLVHLHSSKAGLAGRLAIRGRIATVFQPHAWSFEAVNGLPALLSRAWERRAERWTHVTVCVSEAELAAAPAAGIRTHAAVIPNAVDPAGCSVGDRAAARAGLGLNLHQPYAVCVGRLCEQKGQDALVALWPAIREEVPGAQLVLVGGGPLAQELSLSCPPGVILVGPQDAADWYAAADLVIVPSRWEAMAMVPLEAQAAGRMVVGYDVAGMAESLGPENILVPSGDRDAMTAAVRSALLDLPGTHDRGLRGRDFAVRTWSPHLQLDLLRTVYRNAQTRSGHRHRPEPGSTLSTESVPTATSTTRSTR